MPIFWHTPAFRLHNWIFFRFLAPKGDAMHRWGSLAWSWPNLTEARGISDCKKLKFYPISEYKCWIFTGHLNGTRFPSKRIQSTSSTVVEWEWSGSKKVVGWKWSESRVGVEWRTSVCLVCLHKIQIMIWFKSWLNHIWWFDLSTKDLISKRDLIYVIWFVMLPNHKFQC